MSYITPAQMLQRYDARVLGDLCSDSGVRVSATDLANNATLQTALDDASGWIDTAVFVGSRYAVTDLQSLAGQDQAILLRLNADIAYCLLVARRGNDPTKLPQWGLSQEMLQRLRDGERVFAVQANKTTGNMTAQFVSSVQYADINLERDYCQRYFPQRRQQMEN